MDFRLRVILAESHFLSLTAGEMPCDYVAFKVLGEEEDPTISPRVVACFYVAEGDEHAVDMIVVVYGGAGKEFVKTELGVVSGMKVDERRIREQSGEQLTSLSELLESESGDLLSARRALHETQLPFATVLVGRKLPDLERGASLSREYVGARENPRTSGCIHRLMTATHIDHSARKSPQAYRAFLYQVSPPKENGL